MRKVLLLGVLVSLFSGVVWAQEAPYATELGGTESLQSGGGDGGQFPEGANNCSGDRHHHAHNYPVMQCPRQVNPHFTTVAGGGDTCVNRTKNFDTCTTCCSKQRTEAEECHCFEDYCTGLQPYVEQKCKEDCIGEFIL